MPQGIGYNIEDYAQTLLNQYKNRGANLMRFMKGSQAAPLNSFMGRGVSTMQAQKMQEADVFRRRQQGLDAYSDAQASMMAGQGSLLGMLSGREIGLKGLDLQREQLEYQKLKDKKDRRASFLNAVLGIGGTLAGFAIGGPAGAAVGGQLGNYASSGFSRTGGATQNFSSGNFSTVASGPTVTNFAQGNFNTGPYADYNNTFRF